MRACVGVWVRACLSVGSIQLGASSYTNIITSAFTLCPIPCSPVNANPKTLYEYTPRQGGSAIYINSLIHHYTFTSFFHNS